MYGSGPRDSQRLELIMTVVGGGDNALQSCVLLRVHHKHLPSPRHKRTLSAAGT